MRNTKTAQRALMRDAARRLLEKRRVETVEMLESCGVPPRDIPFDADLRRTESGVELDRFVRDFASGNIRFDSIQRIPMVARIIIRPERIPDWIPFN